MNLLTRIIQNSNHKYFGKNLITYSATYYTNHLPISHPHSPQHSNPTEQPKGHRRQRKESGPTQTRPTQPQATATHAEENRRKEAPPPPPKVDNPIQ